MTEIKIMRIRPNWWARNWHMGLKPWIMRRISKRYRQNEIEAKEFVARIHADLNQLAQKIYEQQFKGMDIQ